MRYTPQSIFRDGQFRDDMLVLHKPRQAKRPAWWIYVVTCITVPGLLFLIGKFLAVLCMGW